MPEAVDAFGTEAEKKKKKSAPPVTTTPQGGGAAVGGKRVGGTPQDAGIFGGSPVPPAGVPLGAGGAGAVAGQAIGGGTPQDAGAVVGGGGRGKRGWSGGALGPAPTGMMPNVSGTGYGAAVSPGGARRVIPSSYAPPPKPPQRAGGYTPPGTSLGPTPKQGSGLGRFLQSSYGPGGSMEGRGVFLGSTSMLHEGAGGGYIPTSFPGVEVKPPAPAPAASPQPPAVRPDRTPQDAGAIAPAAAPAPAPGAGGGIPTGQSPAEKALTEGLGAAPAPGAAPVAPAEAGAVPTGDQQAYGAGAGAGQEGEQDFIAGADEMMQWAMGTSDSAAMMYNAVLEDALKTLDQIWAQYQDRITKLGEQSDPLVEASLKRLREQLGLRQQDLADSLNAQGLLDSGVYLDLKTRLTSGELDDEEMLLAENLNTIRNRMFDLLGTLLGGQADLVTQLSSTALQGGIDLEQSRMGLAGDILGVAGEAREGSRQRAWQSGENAQQRGWEAGENATQRGWEAQENAYQREFDTWKAKLDSNTTLTAQQRAIEAERYRADLSADTDLIVAGIQTGQLDANTLMPNAGDAQAMAAVKEVLRQNGGDIAAVRAYLDKAAQSQPEWAAALTAALNDYLTTATAAQGKAVR